VKNTELNTKNISDLGKAKSIEVNSNNQASRKNEFIQSRQKIHTVPTAADVMNESIKMLREIPNKTDYPIAQTTKPSLQYMLQTEFDEDMKETICEVTEELLQQSSIAKAHKYGEEIPYFQHLSQLSRKTAGRR